MLYDPQRLSQLVKCFSFCKAQVAQCVPVQGMSFKGTDNERSGKSFTGPCCLSKEKVSTISLRQSSQFIFLTMIHLPVLTGSQMPKIQHSSDNDKGTYFEYPAHSQNFVVPNCVPVKRSTEYAFLAGKVCYFLTNRAKCTLLLTHNSILIESTHYVDFVCTQSYTYTRKDGGN